jgi:geranylgeranyl diphosphate synthase, type I
VVVIHGRSPNERNAPSAWTCKALASSRWPLAKASRPNAAVLAGADADGDLLIELGAFGLPLGEAFQLRDDVLGVFGDPNLTGKSTLDDLRDGKPTALLAIALQHANVSQIRLIASHCGNRQLDEDGAAALRDIIVATGARAEVEEMIKVRVCAAVTALEHSSVVEPARSALRKLTEIVTVRQS